MMFFVIFMYRYLCFVFLEGHSKIAVFLLFVNLVSWLPLRNWAVSADGREVVYNTRRALRTPHGNP
jgi:hypothetical protein